MGVARPRGACGWLASGRSPVMGKNKKKRKHGAGAPTAPAPAPAAKSGAAPSDTAAAVGGAADAADPLGAREKG